MRKQNYTSRANQPANVTVTSGYSPQPGGRVPLSKKPEGSKAFVERTNFGSPTPRALSEKQMRAAVSGKPLSQVGNNPAVQSKAQRNGYSAGGRQPDSPNQMLPAYPAQPVRHVTPAAPKAASRVGWVDGQFVTPKYK